MALILSLIGGILVLVVVIDVLLTTLRITGGGPLTNRIAQGLWQIALRVHRVSPDHQRLSWIGFGIVLITMLVWLLLLWVGWTLVFFGDERAIINAQTNAPADVWERAYAVGYSLITLGLGDYRPDGRIWQIATVIASANGFLLVTLIVTYLLPLVSAVSEKRHFAAYVQSLGASPTDIIINGWNGHNFDDLSSHMASLTSALLMITQHYLAYPIVYCFHDTNARYSWAVSVSRLAEALHLINFAVAPEYRPEATTRCTLQRALDTYAVTVRSTTLRTLPDPPAYPAIAALQAHGIPIVEEAELHAALDEQEATRRTLRAQVEWNGWRWQDVLQSG